MSVSEDTKVKTTGRMIFLLVVASFTVGGSWWILRGDVTRHERRIDSLEARYASDHDILLEIRADVKRLNRDRDGEVTRRP